MIRSVPLIFLLIIINLVAESKTANHYKGHIIVSGKKISFEVDYSIQKNNLITGTSITALGTSDQTKCKIKGKYNRKTGGIYFYETVVISSKAKYENLNFCLLSAKLKKRRTTTETIYSGNFTGYIRGTKKKCATGTMSIKQASPKVKKRVATKLAPKLKAKPIIAKQDVLYSNIKSKKSVAYSYTGTSARLEIWDNVQPDGDRITLYLDGKKILTNYELQTQKKSVRFKLTGKHYLKIVAENEGKASPNTSRVRLHLGKSIKELTAHIKTGEYTYIILDK